MTFGYYLNAPPRVSAGSSGPASQAGSPSAGVQLAEVLQNLRRDRRRPSDQPARGPTWSEQAAAATAAATQAAAGQGDDAEAAQAARVDLAEVLAQLAAGRLGGDGGVGGDGGGGGSTPAGGFDPVDLAKAGGVATAALLATAGGAIALNAKFRGLVDNTLAINQVLGEYNATIAQANAEAEAAGIRRSIAQGEVIGGGYARLSRAQTEYRDMVTEYSAPIQNLGLNLAALFGEYINSQIRFFDPVLTKIGDVADKISDWLGDEAQADAMLGGRAFLSDVSDGKLDGIGTEYMNPGNRPLLTDEDRRRIFGN